MARETTTGPSSSSTETDKGVVGNCNNYKSFVLLLRTRQCYKYFFFFQWFVLVVHVLSFLCVRFQEPFVSVRKLSKNNRKPIFLFIFFFCNIFRGGGPRPLARGNNIILRTSDRRENNVFISKALALVYYSSQTKIITFKRLLAVGSTSTGRHNSRTGIK